MINTNNKKFALILPLALSVALVALISGTMAMHATADSSPVNVWWPTDGSHVTGVQPFKAQVTGLDVSQYQMFWQVDGGTWNAMSDNQTDYPHKEASVDVTNWNWHGSGPYTVNFIAQQNGTTISQQSVTIYIDNGLPIEAPVQNVSVPATTSSVSVTLPPVNVSAPTQVTVSSSNSSTSSSNSSSSSSSSSAGVSVSQSQWQSQSQTPVSWSSLYVDSSSEAATQAATSQGNMKSAMQTLAAQPTATWFGNWNSNVKSDVQTTVAAATAANSVPVLVAYNIPQRDCGGFSSGGSDNPAGYQSWIQSFAAGIGNAKAIVILEPDALADISCLSSSDQATRLSLLSSAVSTLKANANTHVYIDAGHANWIDAGTMASELQKSNISQADGFSLNVSNFDATGNEVSYGQQISSQVGGKHFVVDTSRNGNGSVDNGAWCNPSGAAIGQKPTTQTGNSLIDAFLWVKTPGESDGNCNGGPAAGQWWPSYAQNLVQNAH